MKGVGGFLCERKTKGLVCCERDEGEGGCVVEREQ